MPHVPLLVPHVYRSVPLPRVACSTAYPWGAVRSRTAPLMGIGSAVEKILAAGTGARSRVPQRRHAVTPVQFDRVDRGVAGLADQIQGTHIVTRCIRDYGETRGGLARESPDGLHKALLRAGHNPPDDGRDETSVRLFYWRRQLQTRPLSRIKGGPATASMTNGRQALLAASCGKAGRLRSHANVEAWG
jgi:hypothetical protein